MFGQLKILAGVWAFECIGFVIYFFLHNIIGLSDYHALSAVGTTAVFIGFSAGFASVRKVEDKAISKTGAPRVSLAEYVLLWQGLGTFIAVLLTSSFSWQILQGGYLTIFAGALAVCFLAIFPARAVNAEVAYTTRRYGPTILFVLFFLIATLVPALASFIPLWLGAGLLVLQGILVVLTLVAQVPVATGARRIDSGR